MYLAARSLLFDTDATQEGGNVGFQSDRGSVAGVAALVQCEGPRGSRLGSPAAQLHWSELTSDPNSPHVQDRRRTQLRAAQGASVPDRVETIVELCRDKAVLNLGCVDQVADGLPLAPLHRRVSAVARRCVGVDIVESDVRSLRDEGLEVVLADATSPDLLGAVGRPFDVVVAGEIIEHVLNVGGLMSAARSVLSPDGVLVVTTPNPYVIWGSLSIMLGRYGGNVDHVASFCPYEMAEIADRTGFRLTAWFGERKREPGKRGTLLLLARLFTRLYPRSSVDCTTMIYLLTPVAG